MASLEEAAIRASRAARRAMSAGLLRVWHVARRQPVTAMATVLAVLAGISLTAYSSIELARFSRVEVRRHTIIYAAGQSLSPGTHVQLIDLAGSLVRLGYTETRAPTLSPGQFR